MSVSSFRTGLAALVSSVFNSDQGFQLTSFYPRYFINVSSSAQPLLSNNRSDHVPVVMMSKARLSAFSFVLSGTRAEVLSASCH